MLPLGRSDAGTTPLGRVDRRVGTGLVCGSLSCPCPLYAGPVQDGQGSTSLVHTACRRKRRNRRRRSGAPVRRTTVRVGRTAGAPRRTPIAPDGQRGGERERGQRRLRRRAAASGCAGRPARRSTSTGQPPGHRLPAQLLVRVDGVRVADRLEHVDVGDRVAVGEAALEVVAALLGQLADRLRLVLGVGVELDARRCTCRPRPPSGWRSTWSAPSISPIGSTTSDPEVETMMTSRPASVVLLDQARPPRRTPAGRRCCAASSATISRTVATSQPAHSLDRNCRIFSIWSWSAPPTR